MPGASFAPAARAREPRRRPNRRCARAQASDAWSVGLLAHEILTLRHPFEERSLATLLKRIAASDYDRSLLAAAPYPQALKQVASGEELLHQDPAQRLTLPAMLERAVFRPAP